MTTIHDAIRQAETQLEDAKRRSALLREASKADKDNTLLRLDVVNADADAAAVITGLPVMAVSNSSPMS
jgi:hypothetical protein